MLEYGSFQHVITFGRDLPVHCIKTRESAFSRTHFVVADIDAAMSADFKFYHIPSIIISPCSPF